MNGPSKIQKYNNFVNQAATSERQGEWLFAAKLWEAARDVARSMHWKDKVTYSENRMAFCLKTAERAAK